MKRMLALLTLLCCAPAAVATDWGQLSLDTQYGFYAAGVYTDDADFTTAVPGPVLVTVRGSEKITCSLHQCSWVINRITSITVTDGVNAMCSPVYVVVRQPFPAVVYDLWTCSATLPAGTYHLTVNGDATRHTGSLPRPVPYAAPYYVLIDGV